MNPNGHSTASPADLAETVSTAARRRQAIKAWRTRTRTEEAAVQARLRGFSAATAEAPKGQLTLTRNLGVEAAAVQADLLLAEGEMIAGRDAANAALGRQVPLNQQLTALRQRQGTLRNAALGALGLGTIFLLLSICLIALGLTVLFLLLSICLIGVGLLGLGGYLLFLALKPTATNALEARLQRERDAAAAGLHRLAQGQNHALAALADLSQRSAQFFNAQLEEDARTWRGEWEALPPYLRGDWDGTAWQSHDFRHSRLLPQFVAGTVREHPPQSSTPFVLPFLGPLLGQNRLTVINGDPEETLPLLHGVILQLASALPHGATFTLMDPAGAGRAFPMQRDLPNVRRVGADLYRDLENVLESITRIIHTYLDDQTRSFEELPETVRANERFEFLFAANFPEGYDRRTIEALQKIARNGPVAGKYLFIQHSADKALPKDLSWEDFGTSWVYDVARPPTFGAVEGCVVEPLAGPQGAAQSNVLKLLKEAKPPETKVAWADLTEPDPGKWWIGDAARIIQAPVGAIGREDKLSIWFGANQNGQPCAHGILGAMPGAGKSNLYHVLICGLAVRYSPEELNLYLIDGKVGVEFQPYRRLPHARVVALHSAPELSRSVLEELIAEMKRRNEVFKRAGVVDLPGYAAKGSPEGRLPRVVLMIDEYQELFEDDRLGEASATLRQLAQQGRSSGLHLLLGSQRFGAAGMLDQTAIFGSIHLRMAMKMSQSDVAGLTEFGREGKRLVEQCDLPGKIVINDQSGEDKSNQFGKVALLETEERAALLDALVAKADAEWPPEHRFATVIFDGEEQPNFIENPQVLDLIRLPVRPDPDDWRRIAVRPIHEQGFGVSDWFAGERPLALWFGQELNVHGQARVILRRRPMENLLLVGDNQPAIYGMLAALLASVAVNAPAGGARVWLADRAVPGTPWEGALETVAVTVLGPAGIETLRTRDTRQAMAWLDDWTAELERRAAISEDALVAEPPWLLLLAGADRLPPLARAQNKFGAMTESPEGEKLKRLYRDGPSLGLHVVLTFAAAGPLKQALDRAQLEQFKHRIVTQMADADSFLLLGKDHAAKLQRGAARPVMAICQDTIAGTETKFKPYVTDAQMPWPEQLQTLADHLARWKEGDL